MIDVDGFVPVTVANAISVIFCAWLIWKINHLPPSIQKRLFPRQIRTLAISDVLFHVVSLCRNILEYLGLFLTVFKVTWGCQVLMPVVFFATTASALSAVHLSMVFLFQAFKRERPLKILGSSLNLIWPISLVIATVESLFFNYKLNPQTGFCVPGGLFIDPIYTSLMLLSFLVCLAAGLAILLAARSEDSWPMFRGRSWRLALVYPLNFAITQGLIIFLQFYHWPDRSTPVLVAALTMQNLNGFVNSATYLVQQLMVRRRLRQRSHRSSEASRQQRPSYQETLEGGLGMRRSQTPNMNFTSGGGNSLRTEASLGLQRPLQENFAASWTDTALQQTQGSMGNTAEQTQGSIGDAADGEVATADLQALLRVDRSWRTCWGLSRADGLTTFLLVCLGIVVGIWIGKDMRSESLTLGIVFLVTGVSLGYAVASVSICYQPREDPAVKVRRAVARRRLVHKLPQVSPHDSRGAAYSSGCPICLEEFEVADPSEQVLALPCFHQFHKACVEQWLQEKDMCPVCRHDIFTNSFAGHEFCENERR